MFFINISIYQNYRYDIAIDEWTHHLNIASTYLPSTHPVSKYNLNIFSARGQDVDRNDFCQG